MATRIWWRQGAPQDLLACVDCLSAYPAQVSEHQSERPILALLLRLGAALTVSVMLALVKLAEQSGVHLVEILFWRQMPTVPALLAWFAFNGGMAHLATRRLKAHAARAMVGLVSMSCYFGSVTILPLAEATTITFSSSIWAVMLSALLLHEKVGIYRWTAVGLGFAGVLVIAQPGSGAIPLPGAALALTAAVLIALISIQIRDLGRTEEPLTVVFYFALFTLPVLALLMPIFSRPLDSYQWALMAALGGLGLLSQFLLTAALRFGVVASVMVMDYTALLWAALLGWGLFDTLPPFSTFIGAPLVVGAGMVVAWREHKIARARSAPLGAERGTLT